MKKSPEVEGKAYYPVQTDLPMAAAMQALRRGEATPEQQTKLTDWLINDVCRTYDLSWRESERETSFAEGRRFVGLQLVKFIKIDLNLLKRKLHDVRE